MRDSSTKALLFDLGGVVFGVDFEKAFSHWAHGAGMPVDDIKSRFRVDALFEQYERGEIESAEYFDALRRDLGIAISDEELTIGWNAIFEEEFAGAFDLLRSLAARVPIYAFSNSNVVHQEFWERRYAKVLSLFAEVFVSCDLGMRKPEAKAFRHVTASIGREPESILFFDDIRENVDGARAVGMSAVHVFSFVDVRGNAEAYLA